MKQPLAIAQALAFTPNILSINKRFAALGICTKQKIFQQQLFQICQTMKKIRHLLQLNNPSIVHAITEKNSHHSREFEGNGIQDIEMGENKIAARSAP
jgi:ABC-type taurine transport system ATPase subunit